MQVIVRKLLEELLEPPVLVYLNRDTVTDNYYADSEHGFGAILEQEQDDLSVCPILCISGAIIDSE